MESGLFETFSAKYKLAVESEIQSAVTRLNVPASLKEAMAYSLAAGGKRIRPLLLFATMDSFGEAPEKGILAAAAIEMIHTYSLIHDDLPSMDNDDLRRGKPTNHKVFGEAMAILAGDALLTFSFELLGEIPELYASSATKLKLVIELARAAGAEGMVGGQAADMEAEGEKLSLEELEYIHINKTGKLLSFSVNAGALLSNASSDQLERLNQFAFHLGLAFQIRDDILDLEGDEVMIGKPVGSDTTNEKSTYPGLLTLDGAKEALALHISKAKENLEQTGLKIDMLMKITDLVGSRNF